ncbi:hypothetical protein ACFSTH_13205 [Paenibacillus yanchengensis]|uniref:DUF6242 domain-containing protein n=1 Tax=Paenibacillus yanchengensis TaxID=2035833 RepID=A0ABW4YP30_9BACL
MAKTNWTMYDTVKPEDLNQIGEDVNEAVTVAGQAEQNANDYTDTAIEGIVIPTPDYPVTSVNAKTGAVTLDATDISATGGTNVQAEINSLKSSVSDGKSKVAGAITDKGVPTPADATFQTMADNIIDIETAKPFPVPKLGEWISRQAIGNFKSVAYGNGLFVAITRFGGDFSVSSDGISWSKVIVPNKAWLSVSYGNGIFVVVSGTELAYSPDGLNWTLASVSSPGISISYGNGLFVLVGGHGLGYQSRIMTSPDGITWTLRQVPSEAADNHWYSVTYGNGLFVVTASLGDSNKVLTSPNGITWTTRQAASDSIQWLSIVYGNNLFVSSSSNSNIMTSPDGITWTLRRVPSGFSTSAIRLSYGKGMYIGISGHSLNKFTYSYDGIVWFIGQVVEADGWQSVTYANGLFVAVADSGTGNRVMTATIQGSAFGNATPNDVLLDSTFSNGEELGLVGRRKFEVFDVRNIASRHSVADIYWRSVIYGNDRFVAVGVKKVMSSTDGVTWTEQQPAPSYYTNWYAITYGNGLFVAVGMSGTFDRERVMTSPDGVNWSIQLAPMGDTSWIDVTYGNGLFVAIASSYTDLQSVMTSSDGVNWYLRTGASEATWNSIVYGNGMFVAVSTLGISAGDNRVMTSPDGITWTAVHAPTDRFESVAYGNGMFVAVGSSSNKIMTSPDGSVWTLRTHPPNQSGWQSVTFGDGLFVAVANRSGDKLMMSENGIDWTTIVTPDNEWSSITYGKGLFVAVATSGTGNRAMSIEAVGTLLAV